MCSFQVLSDSVVINRLICLSLQEKLTNKVLQLLRKNVDGKSIFVDPITLHSSTLLPASVTLSVKATIKSMVDEIITLEPAGSVVESVDFFVQMRDLRNIQALGEMENSICR